MKDLSLPFPLESARPLSIALGFLGPRGDDDDYANGDGDLDGNEDDDDGNDDDVSPMRISIDKNSTWMTIECWATVVVPSY